MEDSKDCFTIPRFGKDVLAFYVGQYQDGSGNTAVQIVSVDDENEIYATISVNVPDVRLPEGEFVFKTYSENEGVFQHLLSAAFIELTGRYVPVGMAGPQPVCRLKADPLIRVTPPHGR